MNVTSYRVKEWVKSHIWMSHVTCMNKSCPIYEWVMSHIWMSRVTHMNESCHTYDGVISHIGRSHVTHMNESCHIFDNGCAICQNCRFSWESNTLPFLRRLKQIWNIENVNIAQPTSHVTYMNDSYMKTQIIHRWMICVTAWIKRLVTSDESRMTLL